LQDCDYRRKLASLPVKYAGLAIPDPSAASEDNYEASTLVCSHLLAAFQGVEAFSSTEHQSVRTTVTAELKVRKNACHESTLESSLVKMDWTVTPAEPSFEEMKLVTGTYTYYYPISKTSDR
jgi:hypothetical protein